MQTYSECKRRKFYQKPIQPQPEHLASNLKRTNGIKDLKAKLLDVQAIC